MPVTLKTLPRRHPRKLEKRPPREATPIYITAASVMGAGLTLTFDQAVLLCGTPGITTNVAGAVPVLAHQQSSTTVIIIFSSVLTGASSVNLPFRDPAIRNSSGGYVTSSRFGI
jgi:hypothetical protein